MKFLIIAVLTAFCLLSSGGYSHADDKFDQALALLLTESQQDFCAQNERLEEFVADERFQDSMLELRQFTFSVLAGCADQEQRYEDLYVRLDQLSELSPFNRLNIIGQLSVALQIDRDEDLDDLLLAWVSADLGPQIDDLDTQQKIDHLIGMALSRLESEAQGTDRELVVLEAFREDGYSFVSRFQTADSARFRHATILLDRNDYDGAKVLLAEITSPTYMLDAQIDNRFDPVMADPQFQSWADIRARYEDYRNEWLQKVQDNPDYLAPINQLISVYMRLGQNEAAEKTILTTLTKMEEASDAFKDQTISQNWLRNNYAKVLFRQAKVDAALKQYRIAISAGENGATNVSQTLNLSAKLCDIGRPQDALNTLEMVPQGSPVSDYGETVRAGIQVCAYAQLGQTDQRDESLAYLEAHSDDSWGNLMEAYLASERFEDAVQLLEDQFEDSAERISALRYVQNFEGPGETYSPDIQKTYSQRKKEIIADPRIQKAIEKTGRVKTWPIN